MSSERPTSLAPLTLRALRRQPHLLLARRARRVLGARDGIDDALAALEAVGRVVVRRRVVACARARKAVHISAADGLGLRRHALALAAAARRRARVKTMHVRVAAHALRHRRHRQVAAAAAAAGAAVDTVHGRAEGLLRTHRQRRCHGAGSRARDLVAAEVVRADGRAVALAASDSGEREGKERERRMRAPRRARSAAAAHGTHSRCIEAPVVTSAAPSPMRLSALMWPYMPSAPPRPRSLAALR